MGRVDRLESTIRDKRWIDGLSLMAASKRYNRNIIVAPASQTEVPMRFGDKLHAAPIVMLYGSHHSTFAIEAGAEMA